MRAGLAFTPPSLDRAAMSLWISSGSRLFITRSSFSGLSVVVRCLRKTGSIDFYALKGNHVQLCSTRGHRTCVVGTSDYGRLWWSIGALRGLNHSAACMSEKRVQDRQQERRHESVVMEVLDKSKEPKALTVGAKAIEAGKDVTYLLVILGGFAILGLLFYFVGSEFFSSNSPSTIFTMALKRVKADERVQMTLGEPISGHGEKSGRNRRRHINHLEYEVDGVTYMRMKFHVSGSKRKGEVFMDLKKNDSGKYECRFLYVQLVGYPSGTIILEDNR